MSAPLPSAPPGRPRPQPSAIGFASLWRAVRRYSVLSALFLLLAGGAGAAVWFYLPLPKNTGQVIFEVKAHQPTVIGYGNNLGNERNEFLLYRQFQAANITSTRVVNAALADPAVSGLQMLSREKTGGNPLTWLQGSLKTDFWKGPELMRVSLEGDNPDELVTILKAVAVAYTKEVINKDKAGRAGRLEQLQKAHDNYIAKVRETRNKINTTLVALSIGSSDPVSMQMQERLLQLQISSAESDITRLVQSQRDANLDLEFNNKAGPTKVPDELLTDLALRDPAYLDLQKQKLQLEIALVEATKNLRPGVTPPRVQQLRADMTAVDKELADMPARLKAQLSDRVKGSVARVDKQRLDALKGKLERMNESQKKVRNDLAALIRQKKEFTQAGLEIEGLRDDMSREEAMADKLANDIETIKPELDAPSRVSQWEEPNTFPGVEGGRRMKYTGMAAGGLLLLGLALVQFLEFRNRRVQTVDEVSAGLGLAVIGTVPLVPRTAGTDRAAWTNRLAEAVNATRSLLLSERRTAPPGGPGRTLLVTSAISGEGKTSLSTHLAVSLAGAGRRVLLIDADMRRPAAHKVLGLECDPGLSDYLTAESSDPDALVKLCRVPGLHVLTAGRWRPEAVAALAGDRWNQLIERMAREYEFVLIDSPPVLPVADALAVARGVDAVVLSVMQDKSRYAAVRTAFDRLSLVHANVIGAVVSGVPNHASYYYYYDDRYNRPDGSAAPRPEPVQPSA